MKDLFVIRHADTEAGYDGQEDMERALTDFGRIQAVNMGKQLAALEVKPDVFYSSSAKRAETTANLIATALHFPVEEIKHESTIYNAITYQLLKFLSHIDNSANTVILLGHNPGVTELVDHLAADRGLTLSTCNVCHLQLDIDDWAMIDTANCASHDIYEPNVNKDN